MPARAPDRRRCLAGHLRLRRARSRDRGPHRRSARGSTSESRSAQPSSRLILGAASAAPPDAVGRPPRDGATLGAWRRHRFFPRGFELPLKQRLPRIGSIDQVARRGARGRAREALDQEGREGLGARARDPLLDLTTLEGQDTPGKVAALCSKAIRPDPSDPNIPSVAAVCVYPNLVADREGAPRGHGVKVASRRDRVPERAERRSSVKLRGRRGRRRARRRRDRHGDRPRRVPLRPLREGLRRDRARQGGVRRRAPEGDPRGRGARHLRQRPPRVAARDGRRRRLHQDVDRQAARRGDAAGAARACSRRSATSTTRPGAASA